MDRILEWDHTDGSECDSGYMMEEPFPAFNRNWWCTEHQKYLVPRNIEDVLRGWE